MLTDQPSDRHDMALAPRLVGTRLAVLVAEGVEDLEHWVTVMRLREAGAEVISVGMSLLEERRGQEPPG